MTRRALVLTIFYNVTAGYGDNLILPTVKICCRLNLRHFNLGNVCGTRITILIKVLVNNKNRGESYVTVGVTAVSGVKQNLCIEHDETERLTNTVCGVIGIPAQAGIHSANYITVAQLLSQSRLLRHYTGIIITILRNHTGIAVNNLNIFIVKVGFHYKQHLSL